MTLPVTRKIYVIEKYIFTISAALVGSILSITKGYTIIMAVHLFGAIDVGSYVYEMKIFELSRKNGIRQCWIA